MMRFFVPKSRTGRLLLATASILTQAGFLVGAQNHHTNGLLKKTKTNDEEKETSLKLRR